MKFTIFFFFLILALMQVALSARSTRSQSQKLSRNSTSKQNPEIRANDVPNDDAPEIPETKQPSSKPNPEFDMSSLLKFITDIPQDMKAQSQPILQELTEILPADSPLGTLFSGLQEFIENPDAAKKVIERPTSVDLADLLKQFMDGIMGILSTFPFPPLLPPGYPSSLRCPFCGGPPIPYAGRPPVSSRGLFTFGLPPFPRSSFSAGSPPYSGYSKGTFGAGHPPLPPHSGYLRGPLGTGPPPYPEYEMSAGGSFGVASPYSRNNIFGKEGSEGVGGFPVPVAALSIAGGLAENISPALGEKVAQTQTN